MQSGRSQKIEMMLLSILLKMRRMKCSNSEQKNAEFCALRDKIFDSMIGVDVLDAAEIDKFWELSGPYFDDFLSDIIGAGNGKNRVI